MIISRSIAAAAAGAAIILCAGGATAYTLGSHSVPVAAVATTSPSPAATVTVTPPPAPAQTVTAPPPAVNVTINNNAPAPGTPVVLQPVYALQPSLTDPWAVVSEYYSLIGAGDFTDAWNLQSAGFQGSGPDNFAVWSGGYADTGAQTLTFVSESGDTVYVGLAAVDTATGLTQYFTGSFEVDGGLITSGSMAYTGQS